MRRLLSMLLLLLSWQGSMAQADSSEILSTLLANQLEPLLDNLSAEGSFEFNTLGEEILTYLKRPLDLNRASSSDLYALGILDDIQISNLLRYREDHGNFISIYELQAIPSFDLRTIALLRHFTDVQSTIADMQLSPMQMATQGTNELYLRWTRFAQQKMGFKSQNGSDPAYLGDANQYYIRFRHHYAYKFSYGITMEKDPGEVLWSRTGRQGPAFMRAHLYLRDYSKRLQYLALGDFTVSLGQGLIMHSGYGRGKSALVTSIKKGGHTIKPYTSVNEFSFLRGAALGLRLGNFSLVIFASSKHEDANIIRDSLDGPDQDLPFSSLQSTGLHRTKNEIEDKESITRNIVGGKLGFKRDNFTMNANLVHARLNGTFAPQQNAYSQFYRPNSALTNVSLDYTYMFQNFHLFGEGAVSSNGGLALLNGLLIGLNRYADLAILYRRVDRSYQGLQSNAFLESTRAVNEEGLYLGTKITFSPHCWLNLYADVWKNPWLSFAADAPSEGREYFARLTYFIKRKVEAYAQFRNESKPRNYRSSHDQVNRIRVGSRKQLRLHISHKVSPSLELRNRIEFSYNNTSPNATSKGLLLYQDVIFRSMNSPISFTARVAYFDTDDFASRIYAYENDVLHSFSIPAYYHQGFRYYGNLRWKASRNLVLEFRWEESRFHHLDQISTGHEAILGRVRSRFKFQMRYGF
ncbi:MAG: helix-hairpin-helix domain-containing protein [Saprospiraceae bacterium]|nr:helix-hairpin-helix domain-containing protein [Saprospiraceae bacterium]